LNLDPAKTSASDVVFRPAAGASVVLDGGEFDIFGKHVEFRDMRFRGGWYVKPGADDVTLRNIWARHMFITSASNIRVLGGEIGPGEGENYDSQIKSASADAPPPTNILLDGVWFHDWWRPAGTSYHTECLQVGSGVNVTIRNSRFERCATHDIFIRSWGAGYPLKNWLIENNFFDDTLDGYYALSGGDSLLPAGDQPSSLVVRYNSALQNLRFNAVNGTAQFYGNIMPEMSAVLCSESAGTDYDWNVYERGSKCGGNDLVAAVGYRNRAATDLHLLPGSAAIGRGKPGAAPSDDIDHDSRPAASPDAGADEAG
jgi:hypothetical protein